MKVRRRTMPQISSFSNTSYFFINIFPVGHPIWWEWRKTSCCWEIITITMITIRSNPYHLMKMTTTIPLSSDSLPLLFLSFIASERFNCDLFFEGRSEKLTQLHVKIMSNRKINFYLSKSVLWPPLFATCIFLVDLLWCCRRGGKIRLISWENCQFKMGPVWTRWNLQSFVICFLGTDIAIFHVLQTHYIRMKRERLSKRDSVISCFTFFSLGTFWSTLLTREKSPGLILLLQSPDLI